MHQVSGLGFSLNISLTFLFQPTKYVIVVSHFTEKEIKCQGNGELLV